MLIFVNDCSHSYRKYNNFLSQKSEKSERNFVKNHQKDRNFNQKGPSGRPDPKKGSVLELVPEPLDRRDVVVAEFLAELADVDVDGAVAHHHLGSPYPGVDLLAGEEPAGFGAQQRQQGELLAGQRQRPAVEIDQMALPIAATRLISTFMRIGLGM